MLRPVKGEEENWLYVAKYCWNDQCGWSEVPDSRCCSIDGVLRAVARFNHDLVQLDELPDKVKRYFECWSLPERDGYLAAWSMLSAFEPESVCIVQVHEITFGRRSTVPLEASEYPPLRERLHFMTAGERKVSA